ncbi:TolC family protein [Maricaulaceae bacterium NA33B04]|nr:TolC family protein [Maricaulaceae bacterium NA33B04]
MALSNAENRILVEAPVQRAEGTLTSLQTWRNPTLSVEREAESGLGRDGSEISIMVEREFDISGRRALQSDGARLDVQAALFNGFVTQADLRAETLTAFYGVLAAEAELASVEALQEQLASLEAATRQRVTAGDASQLDLERVRQETLALPSLISETRVEAQSARDRLFIVTASERALSAPVAGQLMPDASALATASPAEQSARVAVLEAQAQSARSREEAASRFTPDLSVGVGLRHSDGMGSETGVLVGASVPLPLFDRNQGERQAAAADARLAEARLRRERRRIEGEVTMLRRRAAALHQSAVNFEAEALTSARDLRRIALVSYRAGEIGALEAIDATRAAHQAELRAISLKHRAREAFIALDALLAETE